MPQLRHQEFQFFQFQHCNESKLDYSFQFHLSKFKQFIKTYLNCFKLAFSNLPNPSTQLSNIYMKMCKLFNSFRPFDLKFINYKLRIFWVALYIFNFKFARRINYMLSVIWPILFRLMTTLWVIKRAKHNDNSCIFIVGCFPEIIKILDRSLAEHSKYFAID